MSHITHCLKWGAFFSISVCILSFTNPLSLDKVFLCPFADPRSKNLPHTLGCILFYFLKIKLKVYKEENKKHQKSKTKTKRSSSLSRKQKVKRSISQEKINQQQKLVEFLKESKSQDTNELIHLRIFKVLEDSRAFIYDSFKPTFVTPQPTIQPLKNVLSHQVMSDLWLLFFDCGIVLAYSQCSFISILSASFFQSLHWFNLCSPSFS